MVCELVANTRALLPTVQQSPGDAPTAYVLALTSRLNASQVACGGRRAATLCRNLLAVHAACLVLGRPGDERAAYAALYASIPDVVRRVIPRSTPLAVHQAAWREAAIDPTDPVGALLAVRDPRQRAVLVLPDIPVGTPGEALCDSLSVMPQLECEVLVRQLFPRVPRHDTLMALNALVGTQSAKRDERWPRWRSEVQSRRMKQKVTGSLGSAILLPLSCLDDRAPEHPDERRQRPQQVVERRKDFRAHGELLIACVET